ncbi:FOXM1-like protein [Mya arenaria]|uniref:FOXM1-like protein n=1 Tax=Mya arenaria TaxID=6604 RepID=A0ABY7E0G3_MYAAR|nr:uncharacterized protein LOC128230057 [Mya arenaria]WAR02425.1 FOXM1-like protein [Mya arenaria]
MCDREKESTENVLKAAPASSEPLHSHGQIQKISQDGSKSTYMIILSKDCFKEAGFSDLVTRRKYKPLDSSEDVKLNLSNIDDEEYDSNRSASSVFLKQESGFFEQDSAIDIDPLDPSLCEKSTMNTYIIPSPLSTKQTKKPCHDQHTFPVICQDGSLNPEAESNERPSTARKIVLVTPTTADGGSRSILKKSVAYTNDAVPVINKGNNPFHTPASLLLKNNPKAVPTFSNISPINQQFIKPSNSTFVPITPAGSYNRGATPSGPYTSTPLSSDGSYRTQHTRHESSSHRPVYIIPSPFTRQNKSAPKQTCETHSLLNDVCQTPSLNNSSGFISGSSSLETPDASLSFNDKTSGYRASPMDFQSSIGKTARIVELDDGSGGVVVSLDDDVDDLDLGIESMTSSQESTDTAEKGSVLNKSLTNMQWLKGMQLKEEQASQNQTNPYQNVQWTTLTPEEISKICNEYTADKRPPFAYMVLIQMALCSRPDRRMMLKEICKWIEDTFPYYKFTAKRGWKNSIRHNLSLYNIFERETGKRHGSYWTIKSNLEPKTKSYQKSKHNHHELPEVHRSMPTLPSQIPLIPLQTSGGQLSAVTPQAFHQSLHLPTTANNSRKKGPTPILPRPTPASQPQAYALIPLGHVNPSFSVTSPTPPSMYFMGGSGHQSACPSPIISEVSAAVASIHMSSASPIPTDQLGDTSQVSQEHIYTKKASSNILKQAWIKCQTAESTASSVDSEVAGSSEVTSSAEVASSSEFSGNRAKSKRPRVKPGLPKPTLYKKGREDKAETKLPGSKRRKLQQKVRELANESSDEEDDGSKFISELEKEMFSAPYDSMETGVMDEILNTSTPAPNKRRTKEELPSPIHAFTPVRGSTLFDGSFLDSLGDKKILGLSLDYSEMKGSGSNTPRLGNSPNSSLLDFNVLPFVSPDKLNDSCDQPVNLSNHNLSRILSECGLDPNDNPEHFPNLNWSVVQQMVDSMDTT